MKFVPSPTFIYSHPHTLTNIHTHTNIHTQPNPYVTHIGTQRERDRKQKSFARVEEEDRQNGAQEWGGG